MKIWNANNDDNDQAQAQAIEEAAEVLRSGGLVAFPTETVYGLGANAFLEASVRNVFAAKGRPADNPLIVHIASPDELNRLLPKGVTLSPRVKKVTDAFWPGPLTVLVPAGDKVAPSVRPGLDMVGVRCPNHPVALKLLQKAGVPVAAPSANLSGRPSPTKASDVIEDLEGKIDGVVDGGSCDVGLESTVLFITDDEAIIYRPGSITKEDLERVLGTPVALDAHLTEPAAKPKSPGMKYRHYAPEANVHVWWGDSSRVYAEMERFARDHADEPVAVLAPSPQGYAYEWTPARFEDYTNALSRELYGLLRHFDRLKVKHILIHGVESVGMGRALMNRLQKAAEGRLKQV